MAGEDFEGHEIDNGHSAAAVLARATEAPVMMTQRMPVKVRRVELTGDWAGWWADMHMNPPIGLIIEMESGTAAAVFETLPRVVKAWNFGDPDGQDMPITADGMRALPPDLLEQLVKAWADARGLPKTPSAT